MCCGTGWVAQFQPVRMPPKLRRVVTESGPSSSWLSMVALPLAASQIALKTQQVRGVRQVIVEKLHSNEIVRFDRYRPPIVRQVITGRRQIRASAIFCECAFYDCHVTLSRFPDRVLAVSYPLHRISRVSASSRCAAVGTSGGPGATLGWQPDDRAASARQLTAVALVRCIYDLVAPA